jgi:hypothetical protein
VDFIKLSEKLLKEETEYGKVGDIKTWIMQNIKLLSEVEFITSAAKLLRGVSAEDQIAAFNSFIKEVK